jgi:molybdenum ABC transporter, periplasmic molybdate-binding protein
MKKLSAVLLVLALLFAFTGCAKTGNTGKNNTEDSDSAVTPTATPTATPEPTPTAEPVELNIFAAASMTKAMEGIVAMYKDIAPNVTINSTLDSSGTLKTQIAEGADCDIFISASQKSMNELDITADSAVNTESLDFVAEDTRFNIVSNFCVLAVPEGNPAGVASFDDVATDKVKLIALGNSDVPVGQYAQEIFESLGFWDQIQGK